MAVHQHWLNHCAQGDAACVRMQAVQLVQERAQPWESALWLVLQLPGCDVGRLAEVLQQRQRQQQHLGLAAPEAAAHPTAALWGWQLLAAGMQQADAQQHGLSAWQAAHSDAGCSWPALQLDCRPWLGTRSCSVDGKVRLCPVLQPSMTAHVC